MLQDRVALVTGGGRGIGAAMAKAFAQQGANVAIADINEKIANETATLVTELDHKGLAIRADVTKIPDIDSMIDKVVETFGRIDILVNNAGGGKQYLHVNVPGEAIRESMGVMETTEQEWDLLFQLNAKAPFFTTLRVGKQMIKQGGGGRIINITSAGHKFHRVPSDADAAYTSAKAAVLTMTRKFALYLGQYGINVNAICPGWTRTPSFQDVLKVQSKQMGISAQELERRFTALLPTGGINEPEDIASMAVFLAGPGARNITGAEFTVDGGLTMH